MKVNIQKSQVIHIRNHQRPWYDLPLFLDGKEMQYVEDYKYQGCWVNEFLNNKKTVKSLTAVAGTSFGRIVNILKHMGDIGYDINLIPYGTYVLPVVNYMVVWGFANHSAQVFQNSTGHVYLGVHQFAPLVATMTKMDFLSMRRERWIEML